MDFEQKLRLEIYNAPFQSEQRQILKLLLGDLSRGGKITNSRGQSLVKKILETNNTQMTKFAKTHPRYIELLNENCVLSKLL
jgi:hypothetical protein